MTEILDKPYKVIDTDDKVCHRCSDITRKKVITKTYMSLDEKYLVEHCSLCNDILSVWDKEYFGLVDKRH